MTALYAKINYSAKVKYPIKVNHPPNVYYSGNNVKKIHAIEK